MKEYIQRYQAYFEKAHIKSILVDGFLWQEYKRMIKPVESFFRSFGGDIKSYFVINKANIFIEIILKFFKREFF